MLPASRVEYALRGDEALTEPDVRELMQLVPVAHGAWGSAAMTRVLSIGGPRLAIGTGAA